MKSVISSEILYSCCS